MTGRLYPLASLLRRTKGCNLTLQLGREHHPSTSSAGPWTPLVKSVSHRARHAVLCQVELREVYDGASASSMQKMLGRSTLAVTLYYAALLTDDLVNEHRQHSPVAHLLGKSQRRR